MSKEKHYSKNDSKLKQFFSILSSFLLSTSLTVLILFSCIKLGFTNTSQITKAFSTSNFFAPVPGSGLGKNWGGLGGVWGVGVGGYGGLLV